MSPCLCLVSLRWMRHKPPTTAIVPAKSGSFRKKNGTMQRLSVAGPRSPQPEEPSGHWCEKFRHKVIAARARLC